MVALTGPGGAGKTSLALEVARELAPRFQDGGWLVELAPLADSDLLPQAVASALGAVPAQATRQNTRLLHGSGRESRSSCWTTANTSLTGALCAFHLQAASVATLAETLLSDCSALRFVATSRESLRVTGESVWPVPPLAVPRLSPTSAARHSVRT